MKIIIKAGFVAIVLATALAAGAEVPLNNLQGVGGVAFNPLAYPAGKPWSEEESDEIGLSEIFSKPQLGVWYVNLGDVDVDWTALGAALNIRNRLELSYGHEVIAPPGDNVHKNNLGTKLLLVPENAWEKPFIPALSAGVLWKDTDADLPADVDDDGFDFYAVGTKLITELPRPVLLSAGLLYTDERVTGVFGHDEDYDLTGFGNIDVSPLPNVAIGFEYKQGARFDDFKNADYWDAHIAWFVNKNLTLVGAYVNAGDEDSTSKVGLGDGVVLSLQYAF
ncbi:MAG TPA: DUF3034 family protein [bacterium]|nr:DUF3034 family protein [bacterium]